MGPTTAHITLTDDLFDAVAARFFDAIEVGHARWTIPRFHIPDEDRTDFARDFFFGMPADFVYLEGCLYNAREDYIGFGFVEDGIGGDRLDVAGLTCELVRWTGADCRLGRDQCGLFGSPAHVLEEMVVFLAASCLGALLGIDPPRPECPDDFVRRVRDLVDSDPRAMGTAKALARGAVDYLLALQGESSSQGLG